MASKEDSYRQLFGLMLEVSLLLGRIRRRLASPFSIVETYILAEVRLHEQCLAGNLAKVLQLNKGTVSKVVSSLIESGYVEARPDASDKRAKHLSLSSKGIKAAEVESALKYQQILEFLGPLDENERELLISLFKDFADAFGAETLPEVMGDDPMQRELQRVTKITGFLGDDLLGTGHDYQYCEVLFFVGAEQKGMSFQQLSSLFGLEKTAMSRLISAMEEKDLVKKDKLKDQRHIQLTLTASGRKSRIKIITKAKDTLSEELGKLPIHFLQELISLLRKVVNGSADFKLTTEVESLSLKMANTIDDRKVARASLLKLALDKNLIDDLPEESMDLKNSWFVAQENNICQGVMEVKQDKNKAVILAFVCPKNILRETENLIIRKTFRSLREQGIKNIENAFPPLVQTLKKIDA